MELVVRVIPELQSMIMSFAVLLVLYLLLKKLLYEPVMKVLNERKANIQSNIDNAEELSSEAEQLKLDYSSRIEKAREESQDIIEAARKRGEEVEQSIIKEAREEAMQIKDRARREAELEREAAFQDLRKETGDLAIQIASKIMDEQINMENQNQLIDKFIDEVGNAQWEN